MIETNKFDPPKSLCELCGSERIYEYHQDSDGIHIFKCQSCKVQFMNPQYSDAYLTEYYSKYIQLEPEPDELEWDKTFEYCFGFYLGLIEKHSPRIGSLLDIGCGKGHLLGAAKSRGWSVTGYDVDCYTTQEISKKIGVEILCGDFTKISRQSKTFDVITMHHVIEHLKSPLPYLQSVHNLLRDGGILFLAQPNIHSLSALVKFYLEKLRIKRKNVGAYYDTHHHLWYYTPSTLKNLLSRLGFEVLHVRSGHKAHPNQSSVQRLIARSVKERFPWKSSFLIIARKLTQ